MKKIIGIIWAVSHIALGAAFNSTDSYINVPIAKQYRNNEIQFGLSHGYNGSASIQSVTSNRYEMDFKAVYVINRRNQFGLNLVNESTIVGHYQYTISDEFSPYQIAAGVRNITEGPFTTWQDGLYEEDINMSPYIVNTFYNEKTSFSIGYGIRAFQHTNQSLTGLGKFVENLNGIFFGFSFTEKMITILGEYDGKDINFGLRIKPSEFYEINVALTEQFIQGDFNPQHNNAPKRQITFGISSRNLFSHNDYFNKRIRELNLRTEELENRELKRYEQQKKKIEVELIKEDEILKAEVAKLYIDSLDKYNSRKYNESINLLQKALRIDPNNYTLLSRLGSVYYTYGFLDHAAFYWKKAYEINPDAPEMNRIKEFITKY